MRSIDRIVGDTLDEFLTQQVVLDTGEPIIYLGTLAAVSDAGFWLTQAEVHDTRAGHASQEVYISQVAREGITPNRDRVFVMRSAVMSVSRLQDIIAH